MEKLQKGLISVVIPVYNNEKTLKKCISTIKRQHCKQFEVICVNDGSQDSSGKILEKLSTEDDRIRIVNQENQGAFMARKNGVIAAKGEYLTFIDADDEFIGDHVFERLMSYFEREEDIQIVQFGFRNYPNRLIYKTNRNRIFGKTSAEDLYNKYYEDFITNSQRQVLSISLYGKLYKTSLVKKAADNDYRTRLKFGEDQLFLLMIIFNEGFKNMLTIPDVYYKYNQYLGSAHSVGYHALYEYGILKEYQNNLCDRFSLPDYAKFVCNLESLYFLRKTVFDMIKHNKPKAEILSAIEDADSFDCIKYAKSYFKNYKDRSKVWKELEFLSSDYSNESYYENCLANLPKKSLKSKLLDIIR